jgi:hypothetical protein
VFTPTTIHYGVKMLSNSVRLKPGVAMEDAGMALGRLCTDREELGCDILWQGVPE